MSHSTAVSRLSLPKKQKKHHSSSAVAPLVKPAATNVAHGVAPSSSKAASVLADQPHAQPPRAVSLLRSLDSDSDWDSSSESEGPLARANALPAAAAPAADSQPGPTPGASASMPQAAAPKQCASQAQPWLSEIYDLCESSDEEGTDAGPSAGGVAPAVPDQEQPRRIVGSSLPQPGPAAQPAEPQHVSCRQPQHRKRSFDQEGAQPPASAHPGPQVSAGAQQQAQREGGQAPVQPSSSIRGSALAEAGEDDCLADAPEYQAVKSWLQDLGLPQYFPVFLREEIDLSIVHALTAQDLCEVGIAHKPHQQAILAAGRNQDAQCRPQQQQQQQRHQAACAGSAAAPARPPLQPVAAEKQQQRQQDDRLGGLGQRAGWGPLQQQCQVGAAEAQGHLPSAKGGHGLGRGSHQTLLQVWQANNAAQAAAAASIPHQQLSGEPGARELGAGASSSLSVDQAADASGTRPKERELLATLYPQPTSASAAGPPGEPQPAWPPQQQRQLRPSAAAAEARVPATASLWTAAGQCRQVVPGIEERLSRRRAEAGLDSPPREQLARGGAAHPQVDECRGLKLLKLEGLRKELAMHEETAAQLRSMIAALESELHR